MTVIVAGLAEKLGEGLGQQIIGKAESIVAEIILPKKITSNIIGKYIRKAIQNHTWYNLPRESRILLILTRRLPIIKSPILKNILRKIFLKIELATTRGKAIFYGAIIAMKNGIQSLKNLIHNAKRLLTLGIFYLNNPTHYRIYG
ncbi:hypothetical protein [Staphylothermus hellenicus]|uniref:Uncharacterized protein n=1 Tax=Staphylothermus hellenicus (strain DSM 12710 / JCM 10830 / BK20S6-10-b1 / P8) TaxID=591019 RepID=D7D889_STAHD|nr:hypothetical protein [Staphylothermus hellenicus]ADI31985.1 hypothetical protein Shell_0875 [Staphylothermus hellenicus DSM 12710]